jgi:hypothetical protein
MWYRRAALTIRRQRCIRATTQAEKFQCHKPIKLEFRKLRLWNTALAPRRPSPPRPDREPLLSKAEGYSWAVSRQSVSRRRSSETAVRSVSRAMAAHALP